MSASIEALAVAYQGRKSAARELAGRPGDIVQRVVALRGIYVDSAGNHAFPLLALHGALWGFDFFETTGKLGELISYRYLYNPKEKERRLGMLNRFAEGFKAVNREVFIDTHTNYYFTKEHGRELGADVFVQAELLEALNEVHAATASGGSLTDERKARVFTEALRFEQEVTVVPGIERELANLDCAVLRDLCLKPVVRFAYFPVWHHLYFNDFSDEEERIDKAVESFGIAAHTGWDSVLASMTRYGARLDASPG